MATQPGRNGGTLNVGNPGGGGGRPKERIRRKFREIMEKGIPALEKIATGEADGVTPGETIKAIDVAGKYGLGEAKVLLPEEFAAALAEVLTEHPKVDPEIVPEIIEKLIERLKEE